MKRIKRESKQVCPPYLSNDIVGLLMEKLSWKDKFTSSSVCKSWKQVFDEIRHQDMEEEFLPWTLCFDWNKKSDGGTCKLCDPSAQTSYIVKEPTERHLFHDSQLHASRCGWLLFSKHNIFFLYSPFTNQIIKFPESESLSSSMATFSLNPTSPDCMIFEFRGEEYKENCVSRVAYAGGEFFYCLLGYTKLGAFNIKQQEWKVFPGQLPANPFTLCVALNGDIVIPCLIPYYSSNGLLQLQWRFWRFDSSEEKWVNGDEMMEKQVIFVGRNSLASRTAFSVPAAGNAAEFAGKLLYFNFHYITCGYRKFMFDYMSRRPSEDYQWMEDDKLEKIWIHPPFITSKHK
ncbi:hypothetical protein LWI29_014879 [Acer saccharum]|uniref:F-box domain-containing protein n=1 Tax=Acer saccharum TaxID=4024 RepID=A0AA39VE91_ACESA|nr:hypothetical protein LWI29_014879 [Acer saccharum]